VEELAEALRRLATDEAVRENLVRRGRARVAEFGWDGAVQKTWAVYQELTG
jgi:glycosyltransferase involved in cell wall biosynthesis